MLYLVLPLRRKNARTQGGIKAQCFEFELRGVTVIEQFSVLRTPHPH